MIVCGGRDYRDEKRMFSTLDGLGITELAHGAAQGADSLAYAWCVKRRVPSKAYHADWLQEGKAAGPIRNQRMLDNFAPDAVIAFPGGRGTADMTRRAKAAGVRVIEIQPTEPTR